MAQRERERMILWRILLHFSDIALERCLWVRNIISNVEHFGDFTLQLIFFDILYKLLDRPERSLFHLFFEESRILFLRKTETERRSKIPGSNQTNVGEHLPVSADRSA